MAKNITKLLKQAQKMQNQMMKAQQELNSKTFEGTSGGGMVKVVMNGGSEIQSVSINKEVVDPDDVEMLEDLVLAAFSNAQEQVQEASNELMGGMNGGGMGIPGL